MHSDETGQTRSKVPAKTATPTSAGGTFFEVLAVFTRLGLTSFGGPVAHLGYFREEIVSRRRWVSDQTYADLVGLCQFLPGPASSKVGISLGISRAGLWGGLAAWLGFTLPSAVILILFAYSLITFGGNGNLAQSGWLHGLQVVAVAVVAQAVWGMARNFSNQRVTATITILAAVATLLWPAGLCQVLVMLAAGLLGWRLLGAGPKLATKPENEELHLPIPRSLAIICLALFGLLLVGLPLLRQAFPGQPLAILDSFYRSGALVFGGGHVVLPLLQAEVVPPGWITNEQFLAGYGAAQAVPGPLFTFSAYLGAISNTAPNGWAGGLLALVSIFLPAFLLVIGTLPFWNMLRSRQAFQAALTGVNAAVVGLLLAALYHPAWTSAIRSPVDLALGLGAFGLLAVWKWPPWLVVVLSAASGLILGLLNL
ncbi:MAG: chromate transporter, chromate ion transporter family [Chloroflexi bacterium]|jgi:chromate transporter|nr:chromate transporter, chromate ion transporter family [Chloroflexota bacterium]